jgi:phage terminase small subunit
MSKQKLPSAKLDIVIPAPEHLSDRAKALWLAVVPSEAKSPARLALVQTALELLDRADQAKALLDVEGLLLTTASTGAAHLHPAGKLERDNRQLFVTIWVKLGLDCDPWNAGLT